MIPEPTTAITRMKVPSASAVKRRVKSKFILPPYLPQQQPLDDLDGEAAAVVAKGIDVPQPGNIP